MDRELSPVSFSDAPGRCILRLSGALGVADAEAIYQNAREVCENGQDVEVDWSGVTQLDASIAQILLALREALAEKSKCLYSSGIQPAVQAWLQTAGLTGLLKTAMGAE
jgi:anti-anti-sigma regulatory factor